MDNLRWVHTASCRDCQGRHAEYLHRPACRGCLSLLEHMQPAEPDKPVKPIRETKYAHAWRLYSQGYAYEEIARVLEVDIRSARALVYHARKVKADAEQQRS